MPNTREKLEVIAHLGDHITYREGIGICYDSVLAKVIEDAYMTLKYGVTVQQWIPVTDRLPDLELVEAQANDEELYKCLVTMKHRPSRGGKCVREMWYDGEGFVDRDYIDWTELVTHWMPLPEAPKGE